MSNQIAPRLDNLGWIQGFCTDYSPLALSLAKLFIYFGLVLGIVMAAVEAYELYRKARAIRPLAGVEPDPAVRTPAPAVGEVIKGLVSALTGAKAWLALVVVGVVLYWLAGNSAPEYCTRPQPEQSRTPGGAASAAQPNGR